MRFATPEQALMTNKAATGIGSEMLVESFQHVILTIAGGNTSVLTVKIKASMSDAKPDFSAAQSETNRWDYVQLKDLQDNSTINGDSGVALAANDVRQFEVNTNGIRFICPDVSAYTSGRVSVYGKGFENE